MKKEATPDDYGNEELYMEMQKIYFAVSNSHIKLNHANYSLPCIWDSHRIQSKPIPSHLTSLTEQNWTSLMRLVMVNLEGK